MKIQSEKMSSRTENQKRVFSNELTSLESPESILSSDGHKLVTQTEQTNLMNFSFLDFVGTKYGVPNVREDVPITGRRTGPFLP